MLMPGNNDVVIFPIAFCTAAAVQYNHHHYQVTCVTTALVTQS